MGQLASSPASRNLEQLYWHALAWPHYEYPVWVEYPLSHYRCWTIYHSMKLRIASFNFVALTPGAALALLLLFTVAETNKSTSKMVPGISIGMFSAVL